jgi:hypothetical protein
MKTMVNSHAEQELEQLAQQFDHWRQSRVTTAARIPQSLWEQAIALSTVLPRSRVARRLRLSGQALKNRCAAHHTAPSARPARAVDAAASPAALGFVEVTAASSWPLPTPGTEVELHRADGARLRIHSHEPHLPLATLVRTFLETP